jgi:NCAIR mutase (PurE)-related protein
VQSQAIDQHVTASMLAHVGERWDVGHAGIARLFRAHDQPLGLA